MGDEMYLKFIETIFVKQLLFESALTFKFGPSVD